MTFKLNLVPVPRVEDPALRAYLEQQRNLLFVFLKLLNDLGCGLYFVSDGKLAVKLADSTLTCDAGLKVVPSAIDHGALAGLTDDDHFKYVSLTPTGDRNQMVIVDVNTPGLTIEAPSGYVADYLTGLDDLLAQTFAIKADGKGEFTDLDDAFTDPNSHFQGSNDSLQARSEELGFVLKEQTRYWDRDGGVRRWNGHTGAAHIASALTWAVGAADAATTTFIGGDPIIPSWYQADGSTLFTVEVGWFVTAAPGSDQVATFRVTFKGYSDGTALSALTTQDFPVAVATSVTANARNTATFNVTSGSLGAVQYLHVELARIGGGGSDTLTQSIYVVDVRIRSGVKHT